jgi:hypothetical protein
MLPLTRACSERAQEALQGGVGSVDTRAAPIPCIVFVRHSLTDPAADDSVDADLGRMLTERPQLRAHALPLPELPSHAAAPFQMAVQTPANVERDDRLGDFLVGDRRRSRAGRGALNGVQRPQVVRDPRAAAGHHFRLGWKRLLLLLRGLRPSPWSHFSSQADRRARLSICSSLCAALCAHCCRPCACWIGANSAVPLYLCTRSFPVPMCQAI